MNSEAPANGIYIILGEVNLLLANLKRNFKYGNSSHYEHANDPLTRNFYELKALLNEHSDLSEIDPSTFLAPFLEVIKSEETTGPVTGVALTSVDKFISYGLVGINSETLTTCVQQIADSVTHARFLGTDSSNDEVVLMKILHVLRTLMLSPIGYHLTNSSVCEIMQSCFQICFESRLSELLRRSAECILVDMVQLLFARLPQFKEEIKFSAVKKLTMKGDSSQRKTKHKKTKSSSSNQAAAAAAKQQLAATDKPAVEESKAAEAGAAAEKVTFKTSDSQVNVEEVVPQSPVETTAAGAEPSAASPMIESQSDTSDLKSPTESGVVVTVGAVSDDISQRDQSQMDESGMNKSQELAPESEKPDAASKTEDSANASTPVPEGSDASKPSEAESDYVNPRGVRFVQEGPNGINAANIPYGLPCVRELMRFLISLINSKNSDMMISMGLNLLTIGIESGVDHISSYQSLLVYIKDDLCKHLYNLLSSERLAIYASTLRVSFLLFESLRGHLKLQLEHFFTKLMEILVSESPKIGQEQKEMTIDYLLQMLRIPGFAVELYINYDCSLNCTNLFEDLTKLLSKNAFSVQSLLTANSLSLSALLTIVENIEFENAMAKHSMIASSSSADKLNMMVASTLNSFKMPQPSGYTAATHTLKNMTQEEASRKSSVNSSYKPRDSTRTKLRINRMCASSEQLPSHDLLKSVRTKKRLITQSVDIFNSSPSKSLQFLKDNGIFSSEPEIFNKQLIKYLKETPNLSKKVIGEFLSNRKNVNILDEFIKSFNFSNMRIDEALRLILETFRLPGEAPLISTIMEHFAHHWRASNNSQFANDDAAYTLVYAIIMLNVDQHNHNAKKQSTPMTVDEFKKNLSKVNGNGNFEESLLEEIYASIKNEEIVMPAEHTGALRDNYLWKVLIRRGNTSDSIFVHAPAGSYNHEIFNIVWGQTISALSFVYDKSLELSVIQKAINGFTKCAQVAAHYMMSDVFDNIVISLCKFSALSNQSDSIDQLAVNFGMNNKAQLACKTVFHLVHNHGDILRDGWKNILDCIIQLYKAKLLPKVLVECEDYLHPKGRILLIKEEAPLITKPEGSGLFSSFFPFMSADLSNSKGPTVEEQEATKNAQSCVDECHIEQLIHDTKFLRLDSLIELIKALIFVSQVNDLDASMASSLSSGSISSGANSGMQGSVTSGQSSLVVSHDSKVDIDAAVFGLEILVKVVLQNRDRISSIWPTVRNHFYNIIVNANDYSFFLERTTVGLLRISARLLRREELSNEVLSSLRMLLMFKKKSIVRKLSRQVSFGIYDLLRTNAVNIHSNDDWSNIFTILQVYGAGANPPQVIFSMPSSSSFVGAPTRSSLSRTSSIKSGESKTQSNEHLNSYLSTTETLTDRGYTSDSELYQQLLQQANSAPNSISTATSDQTLSEDHRKESFEASMRRTSLISANSQANQYKIDLDDEGLGQHDKKAFAKCCETLTFLIRDMAHVTLQNFESCIHCLRTFVEACVLGDRSSGMKKDSKRAAPATQTTSKSRLLKKNTVDSTAASQNAGARRSNSPKSDDSDDDDQFITSYETLSIQLLDLLDTLHTKAASIFTAWADEQKRITQSTSVIDSVVSNLWSKCWCPILQGIARLSCDINSDVRMHALQYLQRALLVHELQKLSAMEWEACFNKVLFPLLAKLLENIDPQNPTRMEETRMRASTLLCKVFLQHLTTLVRLSTFTALWLTILDYMDKYMKSDKSDLLHDVIPESLKNMLLVMGNTGLFDPNNTDIKFSQLCVITKDRIESFIPGLWEDLFRANRNQQLQSQTSQPNDAPPPPPPGSPPPPQGTASPQQATTSPLASPTEESKPIVAEEATKQMTRLNPNEMPTTSIPANSSLPTTTPPTLTATMFMTENETASNPSPSTSPPPPPIYGNFNLSSPTSKLNKSATEIHDL